MITYLTKKRYEQATYARAARQRAFSDFLSSQIPGSASLFSEASGSSESVTRALGALSRLIRGLELTRAAANEWVVVDYPDFPASVPRRFSVFVVASLYLAGLRVLCGRMQAKIIVQVDDDPASQDQWLGTSLSRRQLFWERAFERQLFRSAERLWVSGQSAAELLCARFRVSMSKVTHVPNGATALDGAVARADHDGERFTFAYTGALMPDTHQVMHLIDAFAEVRDPRARLVLAGPEGEWIPAHMEQRPDERVIYLGCMTAEQVQHVLAGCQVAVLTGQKGGYHSTGFPGKLGAYLGAGLPVICTCGGDAARLIEANGNGVSIDACVLAQTMESLIADGRRYAELRHNARALENDYLWDRIYERAVRGLADCVPCADRGAAVSLTVAMPDERGPCAAGWSTIEAPLSANVRARGACVSPGAGHDSACASREAGGRA